VETSPTLYLPNLTTYVKFNKGDKKNIIELKCGQLINPLKGRIHNIEIYYNPYTTDIETDVEGVKFYNIFTKQEV